MSMLTDTARKYSPFRQPFDDDDKPRSQRIPVLHDEETVLEDNQQKMQYSFNRTVREADNLHKRFVSNIKFHSDPEVRKTKDERTSFGYHPLMLSAMMMEIIADWERSQRRLPKVK